MLRKGFTLIELLIVITIIAILAGAAIPYVQDYVEDARISKARSDLDELKNALIRYELDTGKIWEKTAFNATSPADLVGPYLQKAVPDPWGGVYCIATVSSVVHTAGPDGASFTTDDIYIDFRPPLALSKAYWIDGNKDGSVNAGDQILIRATREFTGAGSQLDLTITGAAGVTMTGAQDSNDGRKSIYTISAMTAPFVPGSDTVNLNASVKDKAEVPNAANAARTNKVVIKAF